MDRVVYCPDQESLQEAEELYNEWSLPFVVGRSAAMEGMEFDEGTIQILNIPTIQSFDISAEIIKSGKTLSITYRDDWMECKNTWIEVMKPSGSSVKIDPILSPDPHVVVFRFRADETGETNIFLHDQDGVLAEAKVKVLTAHA